MLGVADVRRSLTGSRTYGSKYVVRSVWNCSSKSAMGREDDIEECRRGRI